MNRSKCEVGLWLWQEMPEQPHIPKLSALSSPQCSACRNVSPGWAEECPDLGHPILVPTQPRAPDLFQDSSLHTGKTNPATSLGQRPSSHAGEEAPSPLYCNTGLSPALPCPHRGHGDRSLSFTEASFFNIPFVFSFQNTFPRAFAK